MADIKEIKPVADAYVFDDKTLSYKQSVVKNAELDRLGEPKDQIDVVVGDDKDPSTVQPQVKIMRWDNEVNTSVRLKDFDNYTVATEKEKIKLVNTTKEVHLYDITEGEGGYEFEVILKEKPKTNVIEFTLVDKDVEYFYQPELTQEEIDQGASQPENVVGSYAVYASENKTNYVGGKEYKCGKVGHIYRPKIIDSAGTEVWGDLHIENGILSVTIPQDFLDKAVYPVIVDPTFGYTSAGATNGNSENNIVGSIFTAPENGTGVSLTAFHWQTSSSARNMKMNVYEADLSQLINGQTEQRSIGPDVDTAVWGTWNFLSQPSFVASSQYILVMWSVNVAGAFLGPSYDAGATNQGYLDSETYGTWPNPLVPTNDTNKYSIYATYTAGSTPVTVTPGVITATTSLPAPTVTAVKNNTVSADLVNGMLSIPTPSVTAETNVSVSGDLVTGILSLPTPTVFTTTSVSVDADVVTGTFSLPTPTVSTEKYVSVDTDLVTGTLSLPTPSVLAATDVTVEPDEITATLSLPSPSVSVEGGVSISADIQQSTFSIPTPSITVGDGATPAAVTATLSLPTPTVSTEVYVTVSSNEITLTASLPNPSLSIEQTLDADLQEASLTLPAPTVAGEAVIGSDVVTGTLSLPSPSVSVESIISIDADLLTLTSSIPTPSLAVEGGYASNNAWALDINSLGLVMTKAARVPTWTTASRPTGRAGLFGFNRETNSLEIYNTLLDDWTEFNPTPAITVSSSEPTSPDTGDLWVDTS